jgi:membrane protein YdbS with pleckstrin-like domain
MKRKKEDEELLKNERVGKILSPHPLSFIKYQSLCVFLIVWGILVGWIIHFSEWQNSFTGNFWLILFFWGIGLLLAGVIVSLITVRWSIFILYLTIFVSGTVIVFWLELQNNIDFFAPVYTISMSIVGFLLVEWYRRSHKYIISNQRITFKGGIFTKEERTLRYDKIADINAKQGIMGQIFNFGTIIPISQSGFGLGSDESFAAGGVQVGKKKAKLVGMAGGGRGVQTPRARSFYELHGVYPYKEVKRLVEQMVQGSVITPYQEEQVAFQKEQVNLQKQMRDLLKMQAGDNVSNAETGENEVADEGTNRRALARGAKKSANKKAIPAFEQEEDEENKDTDDDNVFEPEQADIQKQMKDLLKMQAEPKDEEPEEDDEEEDEEKS